MIVLGIDPGSTSIGYAIISGVEKPKLLDAGTIRILSKDAGSRLKELHQNISFLIKRWGPHSVAIERIFFAKNAKTALAVSEARGAILLTTSLAGLKVYEYTPLEVKKFATGDGRADKLQVKKMITLTLPETKNIAVRDDAFDAIALALTCFLKTRLAERREN